jgi:hypothetical protein
MFSVIDLLTPPFINSVMLLIYHKLNPDEKLFPMPQLNWTFLSRAERKRVKIMIEEAKDNDILVQMLGWFSAQYMGQGKQVAKTTQALKEYATHAIRQPKSYQVE